MQEKSTYRQESHNDQVSSIYVIGLGLENMILAPRCNLKITEKILPKLASDCVGI